jgi:hypothetical protein
MDSMNQHDGTADRGHSAFATLRRFLRPRSLKERCELCGLELAPDHGHVLDTMGRQLVCACDACVLLFSHRQSGKYRRVSRRIQYLPNFRLNDVEWESLFIPINLAFFLRSTPAGRVLALYPSPAGVTESLVPLEAWDVLVEENPILRDLELDLEALLVNRVGPARECYLVSIDLCYQLAGLVRSHWRGLSGGSEVWEEIGRFFAELKEQSTPQREESHA